MDVWQCVGSRFGHALRWSATWGWILGTAVVQAQSGLEGFGVPWVASTPVPDTLQTQVIPLGPEDGRGLPDRLQYELGFSTFETAATGFLFDSLTVSLARADGTGSTVLVTGDVFGLTIAPLAPGGLLTGGGISVTEIVPGIPLLAGASISFAYSMEVSLPPALSGVPLRTTFDFFNNGDVVASRGYARIVPESPGWALLGLGLSLGWVWRTWGGRP